MSWRRAMERDAVAIAFPDWEWRDDDVVDLEVEYDDGYDPTYGDGVPGLTIWLEVRRAGGALGVEFENDRYEFSGAAEFWAALNRKGSER